MEKQSVKENTSDKNQMKKNNKPIHESVRNQDCGVEHNS